MRTLWLLLALTPLAAEPQPLATVRTLLREAVASHAARVVIPPGVYRGGPERGQHVHLTVRGASDLEIVAEGVTLVCTEPTRALSFDGCRDITLRGLTVDYDPLPFTQGEVVAVDPPGGWLDIRLHAGYPVAAYTRLDIVDRTTRYRKRDKPFMWDTRAELRPDGVVRVTSKSAAGFAQVGDLASLGGWAPGAVAHTIVADNCARLTCDRVTVYTSNCMGFVTSGGEGGHRLLGCRVVPGPVPPGASEPRLLSTEADAILTSNLRLGVLTEDCEIRDAGDDSWSVQSSDYVLVKVDGRTAWLAARDALAVQAGDRLQAALDGPTATVVECTRVARASAGLSDEVQRKLSAAQPWTFWRLNAGQLCRVTLDRESPWAEGASVYDQDRQGNGFVFRRNRVRSSGRVLLKASGLVEGNLLDSPFALSAHPEVPAGAAAGIAELVLRGNTLRDAHAFNPFWSSSQAGAISLTCPGERDTFRAAGVYGRVVIEDNTIEGGNGAGIVVTSARDLLLRHNRLVGLLQRPPHDTGGRYKIDNHAAVWLAQCERVRLEGNALVTPGPLLSAPLVRGPGVGTVDGGL